MQAQIGAHTSVKDAYWVQEMLPERQIALHSLEFPSYQFLLIIQDSHNETKLYKGQVSQL